MNRKIIFKCMVGSRLYGLNRPDSDLDYFSVFMPTSKDILGLQKCEIINDSTKSSSEKRRNNEDDVDDVSYSLPRYLHLLLQNNPNIVETLFATPENIITLEPEFKYLMDNYDKFISLRVKSTFSGYAFSQKKKLITKKDRYYSLKDGMDLIESWAKQESKEITAKYWRDITEEESSLLNNKLKYYKGEKSNCEHFHKGMDLSMIYNKLKSEYEKYGWRVKTQSFDKLNYDAKFGYNLIRLLAEGIQLLSTGKLEFPIGGDIREIILSVRNGEVPYDNLMQIYDVYDKKLLSILSKLPHSPDFNWANNWLIQTLKNAINLE